MEKHAEVLVVKDQNHLISSSLDTAVTLNVFRSSLEVELWTSGIAGPGGNHLMVTGLEHTG